jgi:hypothetical protein
LPDAKSAITKSTPTGVGDALVTITIETSIAEAARTAANDSLHVRDIVIAQLRRAIQQISEDLAR